MKTSRRRLRRLAAAVAALVAAPFITPSAAHAEDVVIEGPVPQEVIDGFAACPAPDLFSVTPLYCLKLTAYDGELKLGDTIAQVEDRIEVVVGIGASSDGSGGLVTEIVPSPGGGSGPSAVKVPGGVLGMPELDTVIDATGPVLGVSATPILGDPGVPAGTELAFLSWLGAGSEEDVMISLPLSIQLDNLLLGTKCHIDEFEINLTTGTTAPPAGVEPLTGSNGEFVHSYYATNWPSLAGGENLWTRTGTRFVDNTFAVPAAEKCDLVVGDLLDQPAGLFDPVVSSQAGLPAPAGNNHAAFSIDTQLVNYNTLVNLDRSPGFVNFGFVPMGESSDVQAVTFTSTGRLFPAKVYSVGVTKEDFEIVSDTCTGATLPAGEQCVVEVRYTPVTPVFVQGFLQVEASAGMPTVGLMGFVAP